MAFLPYLGRGSDDAFWDYNQELLRRFLVTAVYSGVLYVGLAIALATVQHLFALKIPGKIYAGMWVTVAFAFNTWVFCGGILRPLPQGPVESYPRALRVLTHYILIPLVTLYLVILYGYLLQIALQRAWPRGTVGYLVSGFSVLGVLALLFVHPIREASGSRWVRAYARRFYVSLFPLVALLILATWRRVSEYGITEKRYLLLALGLWIAGVAAYFLASRRRDIRVIPVSLCVVVLLSSFGPWGAPDVSRSDQLARLRRLLERHALLHDGKVQPARTPVDFATRKTISAGLDYLNRVHRGAGARSWFDPQALLQSGESSPPQELLSPRMMTAMGLSYVSQWQSQGYEGFSYQGARDAMHDTLTAIPLAGYQAMTMVHISRYTPAPGDKVVVVGERRFRVALEDDGRSLKVADARASVTLAIGSLAERLRTRYPIPRGAASSAEMTVDAEGSGLGCKLVLSQLNGRVVLPDSSSTGRGKIEIQDLAGALFLRLP